MLILLALGAMLSGCGSSGSAGPRFAGSDASQLRALFHGYAFALADADARSVCKLWSRGLQRRAVAAGRHHTGSRTCAGVLSAAFRAGSARTGRTLVRHGRLSRLRIHGARARATVRGAGPPRDWAAAHRDGRWQMSCCLPSLRFPRRGSTAPPSNSRAVQAFLARTDRLCAQAGQRIEALPRVTPATALRVARAGASLDAQFLARLRALSPPASLARPWRSLLATSARQAALDPKLIQAIESRNARQIAAITAEEVALTQRADAEATALNLPSCAQDYVPGG